MQPQASYYYFASILLQGNNGRLPTPMLALLAVICFAICIEADTYLEACAIGDNKNSLDRNPSMKTEQRIAFQRGDFIRFDSKNDTVVGPIENIFVHEVLESQDQLLL